MTRLKQLLAGLTLMLLLGACAKESAQNDDAVTPVADLVVTNADVYTADGNQARVQAFAVSDGKFVALGTNEQMASWIGDNTEVVDAQGNSVTPGFVDGHTHLRAGVRLVHGVDLYGIAEKDTWLAMIQKRANELEPDEWLMGGRWDHSLSNSPLPTRYDLDAVVPDRPVALEDVDGHSTWLNSKALELAGIDKDTPSPEGGEIVKDQNGEPTGILKETAAFLVPDTQANISDDRRRELIKRAISFANSKGITSVHDMAGWSTLEDYEYMLHQDDLTMRIHFGVVGTHSEETEAQELARMRDDLAKRVAGKGQGPMLEFGYVKLVVDGVLSTHTAVMLEPYADAPGVLGIPTVSQEFLTERVAEVNKVGFPVAVHAIGDKGVRMALDAFEASGGEKNRVEHIEVINPLEISRFKALNVAASMQPHHAVTTFHNYLTDRIGLEREANAYVWKSMLDSGAQLILGSDWPTAPFAPLTQLWAAVFRTSPLPGKSKETWRPEQALSFDQALNGLTMAGAIQSGWDQEVGSITVGKWADFVVLTDTFAEPLTPTIKDIDVAATYLAGKKVYAQ